MARFIINIILKFSVFCLVLSSSLGIASHLPVKMFTGSSHYPWLETLQEIPDHNKSWKKKDATVLSKSPVLIRYPKAENPNKLVINSTDSQHSLQLAGLTSFELAKNEVEYFGLHHRNEGEEPQAVNIVLTMSDGSKVNHEIKSAKQGKTKFTGFIADEGRTIKQVEVNTPDAAALSVDILQWGDLSEAENVSSQVMAKNEVTEQKEVLEKDDNLTADILPVTCNLTPEVVQYQCDDGQWLFDVKVSGNDPRSDWWCSNDEDEQCASYEKVVSYGYYSKSEVAQVQLVFTDQDQLSCSQSITVSMPSHCEDACSYHYESGKEVKSCEKDGKLVITSMKDAPSLSLATKK